MLAVCDLAATHQINTPKIEINDKVKPDIIVISRVPQNYVELFQFKKLEKLNSCRIVAIKSLKSFDILIYLSCTLISFATSDEYLLADFSAFLVAFNGAQLTQSIDFDLFSSVSSGIITASGFTVAHQE